jgi:hypothetical protein
MEWVSVALGWRQILANRHDIDVHRREIPHDTQQLIILLAETDHHT